MPENSNYMTTFPDGRRLEVPQDPETQFKVEEIIKKWSHARQQRYNFEVQWQEASQLLLPEWSNTFFYGYDQWPGQKKTQQQIDSTGMLAAQRGGAILTSILTPFNDPWSRITHPDKKLMQRRRVREFYQQLTDILWNSRYNWTANFSAQNRQNMRAMMVLGNMHLWVDELDARDYAGQKGLRYRAISCGEVYLLQNHQGFVDSFFRAFRWTAREVYQQWPERFPATLAPALEQGSQTRYWILQYVYPRSDWQPWRLDAKGKRFACDFISIQGHVFLEESGYRGFPMPTGRYTQAPDEFYGRGPAQIVLPSLKTLNAEKSVFLKQGHRAGDPIYLTGDDDMDYKLHPGAVNKGGWNSKEGKPKIGILPTGNIQITETMMAEERAIIRDAFLVSLFQMAWEQPDAVQKSPMEIVHFLADRGTLIAPDVAPLHDEYLGTLIHRELDILAWQGMLPPLPPELGEADGTGILNYKAVIQNPITRALRASKTASFMRSVAMTADIAQKTGDNSYFDIFEFDEALPDIADDDGVPENWMADPRALAQKRQARQQAQQQEADAKTMPARAAMVKAQAIAQKAQAGQNIGGTLSGTPPGGMPEIPGNPPGQPGLPPAVPGQPGLPGQPAPAPAPAGPR